MKNLSHDATEPATVERNSGGRGRSLTTASSQCPFCVKENPDGALSLPLSSNPGLGGDKPLPSSIEGRRAYQRAYYHAHKEKALEYARKHRAKTRRERAAKKRGRVGVEFIAPRQERKVAFCAADIMDLQGGRFADVVDSILSGKTRYALAARRKV